MCTRSYSFCSNYTAITHPPFARRKQAAVWLFASLLPPSRACRAPRWLELARERLFIERRTKQDATNSRTELSRCVACEVNLPMLSLHEVTRFSLRLPSVESRFLSRDTYFRLSVYLVASSRVPVCITANAGAFFGTSPGSEIRFSAPAGGLFSSEFYEAVENDDFNNAERTRRRGKNRHRQIAIFFLPKNSIQCIESPRVTANNCIAPACTRLASRLPPLLFLSVRNENIASFLRSFPVRGATNRGNISTWYRDQQESHSSCLNTRR